MSDLTPALVESSSLDYFAELLNDPVRLLDLGDIDFNALTKRVNEKVGGAMQQVRYIGGVMTWAARSRYASNKDYGQWLETATEAFGVTGETLGQWREAVQDAYGVAEPAALVVRPKRRKPTRLLMPSRLQPRRGQAWFSSSERATAASGASTNGSRGTRPTSRGCARSARARIGTGLGRERPYLGAARRPTAKAQAPGPPLPASGEAPARSAPGGLLADTTTKGGS